MELVITRSNLTGKKIITIMVFALIGCALCFMGLEIDLAVVLTCIKVHSSSNMIHYMSLHYQKLKYLHAHFHTKKPAAV